MDEETEVVEESAAMVKMRHEAFMMGMKNALYDVLVLIDKKYDAAEFRALKYTVSELRHIINIGIISLRAERRNLEDLRKRLQKSVREGELFSQHRRDF